MSQCDRLLDAAIKMSFSWSGSYLGYHSELYFRDFEKPPLEDRFSPQWGGMRGIPDGWRSRDPEEVKKSIETLADSDFDGMEAETKRLVKEFQDLQNDIIIEFSPLHQVSGFDKEKELLGNIEQFEWEKNRKKYIEANLPGTFMSRDSEAYVEGARIPAHLFYQAVANECGSRCTACEEFLKLARRFLRQVQTQLSHVQSGERRAESGALSLVTSICRRFHLVARQLNHRRQGRPTLQVQDEYDVQDLLHCLLQLHFDDIRSEEWAPSYAGGAARMDFVLKAAEIVIETKMARKNHRAKEVSNELIIDAARYKAHRDCKTLVCFVYDPDATIGNPRGVEADLTGLTTPEFKVVAVIAP